MSALSQMAAGSTPEVQAAFQGDSASVVSAVIDILQSEDLTNRYVGLILEANVFDLPQEVAKGAMLFLLLHKLSVSPEDRRDHATISRIAVDDSFLGFFADFYRIPAAIGIISVAFHAAGTTSLIFKALTRQYGQCALKVIQGQYTLMPSIRNATASYAASYGLHVRYSPQIYDSADSWIFMEFIEGLNLNDYLNKVRRETDFLSENYVSFIADLFHKIAVALAYYEGLQPPMIHGDLTPFNVMVELDELRPKSIKLIDFGPNYVLKDRVGSRRIFVEAFARTELFTAPEVVTGRHDASIKSDLFSLGMIGLDLLCREPLRKDTAGVRLREIWQNPASVGVAQIIEDLIDERPENRVLILKESSDESTYMALDRALQDQVAVYKDLVLTRTADLDVGRQVAKNFLPDVWRSAGNIRRIAKLAGNKFNLITRWQLISADINVLCQAIIVFSFAMYTAMDLKIAFIPKIDVPFSQTLIQIAAVLPKRFVLGDVWSNLSGRCVALTFGLIAARYYANIFASLRVTKLDNGLQRIANILLRANAFSYFVPIMLAIVYDPKWWPFCTFAGVLFPAINNLTCWLTARQACKNARSIFSIETYHQSETERFLRTYKEWWLLMGAYGFGIGAIGLLLLSGIAKDESVYASLVCLVNIFKVYRNNCASEAPFVAGNLARLFFSLRRLSARNAIVRAATDSRKAA